MILSPLVPGRQEDDFWPGGTSRREVLCCTEQAFILVGRSLRNHDGIVAVTCAVVPTYRAVRKERNSDFGCGLLPEPNSLEGSLPVGTAAARRVRPAVRITKGVIVGGTVKPEGVEFPFMARIPSLVARLQNGNYSLDWLSQPRGPLQLPAAPPEFGGLRCASARKEHDSFWHHWRERY
jgi:hypothetical protein